MYESSGYLTRRMASTPCDMLLKRQSFWQSKLVAECSSPHESTTAVAINRLADSDRGRVPLSAAFGADEIRLVLR